MSMEPRSDLVGTPVTLSYQMLDVHGEPTGDEVVLPGKVVRVDDSRGVAVVSAGDAEIEIPVAYFAPATGLHVES